MTSQSITDASVLTAWRKSSYSGSENAACVEVADGVPGIVPVRDSKNPTGPALLFTVDAWAAFLAGLARGEFGAR
ncbi:DUF397 domain-containing protein [Actinacidiphila acididurans]|uniref:DUF397 domain-containing protein n=1 Tax=Actinacidiphila acididurans TaxID=2784346 RepID=A0ABS2U110_9ACTN|nr:DUF397 domain-containing protein [Actinacidiphila acididurans]MBM9509037.1 DUF397 domain-containing protein [Actinacidiphila acididurans]